MMRFICAYGRIWDTIGHPGVEILDKMECEENRCFYNAYKVTYGINKHHEGSFLYVEGFANYCPSPHAWVMSKESGKAVEVTWNEVPEPSIYFGVVFDHEYANEIQDRQRKDASTVVPGLVPGVNRGIGRSVLTYRPLLEGKEPDYPLTQARYQLAERNMHWVRALSRKQRSHYIPTRT